MPTLTINGAALAYDDAGDGPAVVLIHAGIADRRMWRPLAAALAAARYRVIRYDLRGYGESTLPAESFAHHDDLAGLLTALDIPTATLIGCSLGGAVAIDTAIAHPHRVTALALINSALAGHVWTEQTNQLWDELVGDVDEEDLDAMADAEVRFWVVGPNRRPEDYDPRLLAFTRDMDRRALTAEALLDNLDVRDIDPPAADRLAEIRVPTLVMAGAADIPAIHRLADHLATAIPHAQRLPDIPDAAHLLPLEHPEQVATAVLAFLSTLPV